MKTYTVYDNRKSRDMIIDAVMNAEPGSKVTIGESPRSLEQNRLMWPILTCFSQQRKWPINGEFEYMIEEDWKDVLTASFEQEAPRIARAFDDPKKRVLLGVRTSKMSKARFSLWIEYLYYAAEMLDVDLSFQEEEEEEAA